VNVSVLFTMPFCTNVDGCELNEYIKNIFAKMTDPLYKECRDDYYSPKYDLAPHARTIIAKEFKIIKHAIYEHVARVLSTPMHRIKHMNIYLLENTLRDFTEYISDIVKSFNNMIKIFNKDTLHNAYTKCRTYHAYHAILATTEQCTLNFDAINMVYRIFKHDFGEEKMWFINPQLCAEKQPYNFMQNSIPNNEMTFIMSNHIDCESVRKCEEIIQTIDQNYFPRVSSDFNMEKMDDPDSDHCTFTGLSWLEREQLQDTRYIIELSIQITNIEINMKKLAIEIVSKIASSTAADLLYGHIPFLVLLQQRSTKQVHNPPVSEIFAQLDTSLHECDDLIKRSIQIDRTCIKLIWGNVKETSRLA